MNTQLAPIVMPTAALGRVVLPSSYELSSSTIEQDFLSSPEGRSSTTWIVNPPHASYRLHGTYQAHGHDFCVVAWFSRAKLKMVELSVIDQTDEALRAWSGTEERRKHQLQVAMLNRIYGTHPACFAWGTIRSDYDPRGGGSSITIRFAPSDAV